MHTPTDAMEFAPGEIWMSPQGLTYKVIGRAASGRTTLRQGTDGRGRLVLRNKSATQGWVRQSGRGGKRWTGHYMPAAHLKDGDVLEINGPKSGFASICYETRSIILGVRDPRTAEKIPGAYRDGPFRGCFWRKRIRQEALDLLASALGTESSQVAIDADRKAPLLTGRYLPCEAA